MGFQKIDAKDVKGNVFSMLDNDWALVTAQKEGQVNTMTVSWGGMGILWGKKVVTIYIRPQRYTKEFIDAGDRFTLSFFGGKYKKELGHIGAISGRLEDKIKTVGLHVEHVEDQPTFEESELVFVCKKLYEDTIKPEFFKESWIDGDMYPEKDYHTVYIAEIEAVYEK